MASSTLRSGTEAEAGGGVLPTDAIYEILIRLLAEELCRLRVVCRPWRSLLSDPQFIATQAARHRRRPLIVLGQCTSHRGDDDILCRIIDLSGRVIKQIVRQRNDEWVISTQRNLACIAKGTSKRLELLNLVTGDRFSLPEGLSQEHTPRKLDFSRCLASVAFGQVASTEEIKLLRVIDKAIDTSVPFEQLCEVFTHGGSRGARWRGKKAAQDRVHMSPLSRVAIDGVVYFLLDEYGSNQGIASFDLLTEEWRAILRGPVSMLAENGCGNLSLAALSGSLVLVHCRFLIMDLWFLMDNEEGSWGKQYTAEMSSGSVTDEFGFLGCPLALLENGRIVIYIGSTGLLTIYDPRADTYTDVETGSCTAIGLYTGNLLSLANDAT